MAGADEGGSDIASHDHDKAHVGHNPAERKAGPSAHAGGGAPPPAIHKKQDRSS